MAIIEIKTSQLPTALRMNRKRKAHVVATTEMTIPITAGLWDGGSRETFHAVRLTDGATVPMPGQNGSPWSKDRCERTIPMMPGFAVVRQSIFMGKESPLMFYVHPDNMPKLLGQRAEA